MGNNVYTCENCNWMTTSVTFIKAHREWCSPTEATQERKEDFNE